MLALAGGVGRVEFNRDVFDRAVREVFARGGFSPDMLADPAVRPLVEETYNALNRAVDTAINTETPPELTAALQNNAFIFSGFKTYHSLSEVGLALTDADGHVKPFDTFRKDVEAIDARYNTNYLYAEYNHAVHTSQMAVKWHDFVADGDRYNLQYRTAGDERVRSEHAALDNITLPPSANPPGDACTDEPKARMFRYNAGREMTLFPKKHPYLPKGCGSCDGRLNLAYDPKREQCRICRVVHEQQRRVEAKRLYDRLSKDSKYRGVEYDPVSGGITAAHVGHNTTSNNAQVLRWGMTGADLENEVQRLLFQSGHSAILCDESKKKKGRTLPALDMQLDGVMMDIRSITSKKRHYGSALRDKNKQLARYNARSDVRIAADTVCLYFHDGSMYHPSKITNGVKWLKRQTRHLQVKHIVCVVRKEDGSADIRRHDV